MVENSRKSAILATMKMKPLFCALALAAGVAFFAALPAPADDAAASIAAGGLVPRRETRIVMAKEVLRISPDKVVVDYEFRNDTDQDVTTEVAFPIPPYSYGPDSTAIESASFSGFKLLIDGKPVSYQIEAKAALNGRDVTAILAADKIDIPSYGHLREPSGGEEKFQTPDLERLPAAEQQRLIDLGLFARDENSRWGLWEVHLQYHWTQRFPAHSTVHIRHEYTPVEGDELMPLDTFKEALASADAAVPAPANLPPPDDPKLLASFCPDPTLLRGAIARIEASDPQSGSFAYPQWVDFILTSANTWRQPIEDFTLVIERGKPRGGMGPRLISFCSPLDAPVKKLDADHFQIHLTNFVPQAELRIGFFDLPAAKAGAAGSSESH
jgi:hypothetical protein